MTIAVSFPPNFIGCFFDLERQIFFTKNAAHVRSIFTNTTTVFPVKVPVLDTMPCDVAIFRKKSIRHLLQKEIPPVIDGKEVTFVPSLRKNVQAECRERIEYFCDKIISQFEGDKPHLDVDLMVIWEQIALSPRGEGEEVKSTCDVYMDDVLLSLKKFKHYFLGGKYADALTTIIKASEAYSDQIRPELVLELYAETLCFTGDMKGGFEVYLRILKRVQESQDDVRQAYYLKRALDCQPGLSTTYNALEPYCLEAQKPYFYLQAFLVTKVDKFFEKARKHSPNDPFVYLVKLSQQKEGKSQTYEKMVSIFEARGKSDFAAFYRSKLPLNFQFGKPRGIVQEHSVEKAKRKGYLELIDSLIKRKDYEQAEQTIDEATSRCLGLKEKASFLKRRIQVAIHAKKEGLNDLLGRLFQCYKSEKKYSEQERIQQIVNKNLLA